MPRPSLKEQRTQEILDAFARCVARYGVEGSTLDRIAEEAGVKRTILRHYIGNRDDLIAALGARVEADFMVRTEALFDALPRTGRIEWLIEALFQTETHSNAEDVAVAQALISAGELYPDIAERLRGWVVRFDALIAKELADRFPHASKTDIQAVAFGLLGIYFNADALAPLGLPRRFDAASKTAAEKLVKTLEA